tara:strand:+ start:75 stop:665 length:591 start_codon:yes stop_codon:yes gene_type:complete
MTEEEKKAYDKARYQDRREARLIKSKTYREANKDKIKAYQKANKDKIAIQKKAYYQDNKESIAVKDKAYYEANRESILIRTKAYSESNKEAIAIKKKAYAEANKEKIAIRMKTYYEAQRLTHHIVYCLPYYDQHGHMAYAGVTDNPTWRMISHNSSGKNTDDWFILQVCNTREEALRVEAEYHSKGYAGKSGFINK